MTLDEAIKHCEEVAKIKEKQAYEISMTDDNGVYHSEVDKCDKCAKEHRQLAEWLKDYKRLLEQQPCDDAISRQAVDTLVDELARAISDERCCISRGRSTATIMQDILDLPSVTPQPKTGRWIDDRCSVCGKGIEDLIESSEWYRDEEPNFCPFCGIKIESEG